MIKYMADLLDGVKYVSTSCERAYEELEREHKLQDRYLRREYKYLLFNIEDKDIQLDEANGQGELMMVANGYLRNEEIKDKITEAMEAKYAME
jgi:hypothetical protein